MPRETLEKKERWRWSREAVMAVDDHNCVEVALPQDGPLLADTDGLLKVRVRRPIGVRVAPGMWWRTCQSAPLELSTWWSRPFLQPGENGNGSILLLDLPKACIDGMQSDMESHKLVPAEFRLRLTMQEQEGLTATDACDFPAMGRQEPSPQEQGVPRECISTQGSKRWPPCCCPRRMFRSVMHFERQLSKRVVLGARVVFQRWVPSDTEEAKPSPC